MPRCFLLGAGASHAVGLTYSLDIPLDGTFFQQLQTYDRVLYENINRLLKAQFEGLSELRELRLEEVEDLVSRSNPILKTRLESQMKLAVVRLLSDVTGTSDSDVLAKLLDHRQNAPNLQLYHLLLENMANDDYFVSLNYDILLDLSILSLRRSIDYGNHLPSLISSDHWPHDFTGAVKLYKPHGSLNWTGDGSPNTFDS